MHKQFIDYHDGEALLEGYVAYDDSTKDKRPAILVAHAWSGKNEFVCQKADYFAKLGYLGFALDIYGKGKRGTKTEDKVKLMQPYLDDRQLLLNRALVALKQVKNFEVVDNKKIGAIGFCFGGLCVLDLARSGADIKGVVSFHGLLNPPTSSNASQIKAKILALHGHEDPMVPPEQVLEFEKEMTAAKADWQIHVYGNTKHAFTNPEANDEKLGTVYQPTSEKRSMLAMENFFVEVFSS